MTRVLDAKTFVVLGEGMAAGAGHFSLTEDVQRYSFPAQVAERLRTGFEHRCSRLRGSATSASSTCRRWCPTCCRRRCSKDFPARGGRPRQPLGARQRVSPTRWRGGPEVSDGVDRRRPADAHQPDSRRAQPDPRLGGKPPTMLEYAKAARKPTLALDRAGLSGSARADGSRATFTAAGARISGELRKKLSEATDLELAQERGDARSPPPSPTRSTPPTSRTWRRRPTSCVPKCVVPEGPVQLRESGDLITLDGLLADRLSNSSPVRSPGKSARGFGVVSAEDAGTKLSAGVDRS